MVRLFSCLDLMGRLFAIAFSRLCHFQTCRVCECWHRRRSAIEAMFSESFIGEVSSVYSSPHVHQTLLSVFAAVRTVSVRLIRCGADGARALPCELGKTSPQRRVSQMLPSSSGAFPASRKTTPCAFGAPPFLRGNFSQPPATQRRRWKNPSHGGSPQNFPIFINARKTWELAQRLRICLV